MSTSSSKVTPWYREFWAWFVLAPLIVVVLVSSFTISLALQGADDRVVDNYYQEGRMINHRLEEDMAAMQLSLAATLTFDFQVGEVSVQLQGQALDYPEHIFLALGHPRAQAQDHQIQLSHLAKGRYSGELIRPLQHHWYVRLFNDAQPKWRLRGTANFTRQQQVYLAPPNVDQ